MTDSDSEDLLASVFDLSRGAAEVADQVDSPDGGGDSSNALVPISGQGAAPAVLKTHAFFKRRMHHFQLHRGDKFLFVIGLEIVGRHMIARDRSPHDRRC